MVRKRAPPPGLLSLKKEKKFFRNGLHNYAIHGSVEKVVLPLGDSHFENIAVNMPLKKNCVCDSKEHHIGSLKP